MSRVRRPGARLALLAVMLLAACDDPAAPDPPARLEAVPPAQFTAYASTPTNVFVRVLDEDGDPVRGAVVHWRVLEGSGTVAADSSASDELGLAGTTWTMGTAVGETARLEAFVPGLESAVFTATPALPPTVLITTQGGGQTAPANTALANPLVVRVTLPDGRPLAGVPVRWVGPALPNGVPPADPVPQQTVTNAQGEARATLVVPQRAGAYEVTARVGTEPQVTAARIPFTAVNGPVAHVSPLTSPGGCTPAGEVARPPWGLIVFDAYYNPVPGVRVEFEVPGEGFPSPEWALTDALGGATTAWTVRTRVGLDTMHARIPSINYAITFTTQVCPGALARVDLRAEGVAGDTVRLAAGQRTTVLVTLYDRYGNQSFLQDWQGFFRGTQDSAVAHVGFAPYALGSSTSLIAAGPGTTRVWARVGDVADSLVVVVVSAAAPFRGADASASSLRAPAGGGGTARLPGRTGWRARPAPAARAARR